MFEIMIWVAIGLVSGSVPWALLVGKLLARKDIRKVGDGNPGVVNVWKASGSALGVLALVLEIGKSFLPVYFSTRYLSMSSEFPAQASLALVAVAPIVGHGWSPFLRFKGGKALATTWGSWIAITDGVALPVGCVLLIVIHGIQRNHAITVTFCLLGFLVVCLAIETQLYVVLFWIANVTIVAYKHKDEYLKGVLLRKGLLRLGGKLASWD